MNRCACGFYCRIHGLVSAGRVSFCVSLITNLVNVPSLQAATVRCGHALRMLKPIWLVLCFSVSSLRNECLPSNTCICCSKASFVQWWTSAKLTRLQLTYAETQNSAYFYQLGDHIRWVAVHDYKPRTPVLEALVKVCEAFQQKAKTIGTHSA